MDLCKEDGSSPQCTLADRIEGVLYTNCENWGLGEKGIIARQLRDKYARGVRTNKSAANREADAINMLLKTHRENEYKAPMHRARTTRAYWVSFPV
jgi:hypothetical protein